MDLASTSKGQNANAVESSNDQLANSSTVSGEEEEEEIVWIVEEEGEEKQEEKQEAKGGAGDFLGPKEEDRFPDEISGISQESEEQSESREERELEPNRLLASLEHLASQNGREDGGQVPASSTSASVRAEIPESLQKEEEVQLTVFASREPAETLEVPAREEESSEASQKSVGFAEIPTTVFPAMPEKLEEEKPMREEEEEKPGREEGKHSPEEERKEAEMSGGPSIAGEVPMSKASEEVPKMERKKAEDSAIQFSFKSVDKPKEEPGEEDSHGEAKVNAERPPIRTEEKEGPEASAEEMTGEKAGEKTEKDVRKDVEKDVDVQKDMAKDMEKSSEADQKGAEEAASTSSSSSQAPKGVRFAGESGQAAGLNEEDLAKLEEYEEKMRRRSKEALELVDRICGLQAQEQEKRPPLPAKPNVPSEAVENGTRKVQPTENDGLKEALAAGIHGLAGQKLEKGSAAAESAAVQIGEGPVLDVESVSVSPSVLQMPSDCLLLPGQLLLIVDSEAGLSLISLGSKQLQKQIGPKEGVWRNAESACLGGPDGENVYVLLEYNVNRRDEEGKEEEEKPMEEEKPVEEGQKKGTKQQEEAVNGTTQNGMRPKGILKSAGNGVPREEAAQPKASDQPDWRRFVCRFSIPDFAMLDRIEAPKWLRERVVWQCRLCFVPQSQCLYLAANTPNQGFLFELRCPDGRWAECVGTRQHSQYADLHLFAVVGPVTELLLVETNRSYVQLLSVYNSTVVSSRTLGICERPGALCLDERGHLLIFDRATSTVGLFSRAFLEKIGDLALVERAHCKLSARQGILAVLCPVTKELRLHRYEERARRIEQALISGEQWT